MQNDGDGLQKPISPTFILAIDPLVLILTRFILLVRVEAHQTPPVTLSSNPQLYNHPYVCMLVQMCVCVRTGLRFLDG